MLIEGRGKIPPTPEIVHLTATDIEIVADVAAKRNQYRGYARRQDSWGRGSISDPVFVGLLGEHAVALFLNRRASCHLAIDSELRPFGDGGIDLTTDGLVFSIKTRQSASRSNLFRRVDGRKNLRALRGDFHVFCRRESDREIWILGWIDSSTMRQVARHVPGIAKNADWWNLDVDDAELTPMCRLVEEIKLRRET